MIMKEQPNIRPSFILQRGQYDAHGEEVQPGTPAMFPDFTEEFTQNRLQGCQGQGEQQLNGPGSSFLGPKTHGDCRHQEQV